MRDICPRCDDLVSAFAISFFNTELICNKCVENERNHPLYKKAVERNKEEIKKGNLLFDGIGVPEDLIIWK